MLSIEELIALKGIRTGVAKLTQKQRTQIAKQCLKSSQRKVAKTWGLHHSTVNQIFKRFKAGM